MDDSIEEKQSFPGFWSILPSFIRYDQRLNDFAKILYCEISSLADKYGTCWATNEYFSKSFNVSERYVRENIAALEKLGYIKRLQSVGRSRNIALNFSKEGYLMDGRISSPTPAHQFPPPRHTSSPPIYLTTQEDNNNIIYKGVSKVQSDPPSPSKNLFFECVYLTHDEKAKLEQKFGEEEARSYAKKLNDYMKQFGKEKKYKSHYHAILNFARRDGKPI